MLMSDTTRHFEDLKEQALRFPTLPGVYIMRDARRTVIYVGKAKSLRDRVLTYFRGGDGRLNVDFLLQHIRHVETIVTQGEKEAFILERDLITKYKPRYNIRLKDDKAYLSVRIDLEDPWPRLEVVRRRAHDTALYFGPFAFSYELRTLLDVIKKVIPLRSCSDTVFHNRQRPCLEYQIQRCCGPCCLPVDQKDYQQWVEQAIAVLKGDLQPLRSHLEALMEKASEELRFEDAATHRDRLTILESLAGERMPVASDEVTQDSFAVFREEKLATLSVLQARGGRIVDSKYYSFDDVFISDEEIIRTSMIQFYSGPRELPEEILLPLKLEDEEGLLDYLAEKRGGKIVIRIPKRGVRYRLVQLAEMNARHHYAAIFDAESRYQQAAQALALRLALRQMPRKIECIDVSHFQGSQTVGALVSFFDGRPHKAGYRKYKLSQEGNPNDFASIHEVVYRRLEHGLRDENLPDLMIIDGGKAQLAKAREARDTLGVTLDIVALAKSRLLQTPQDKNGESSDLLVRSDERIFIEGMSDPIPFKASDPATNLIARIRDEVHRFVITYHRSLRAKNLRHSILDEVPGIGPERKRRLLKTYGSIKKLKSASVEELAKAGRMPRGLAENLLRVLKEKELG